MPHLPKVAVLLLVGFLATQPAPKPGGAAREDAYRANNLGVAYLEQYNYEQAAASFRRALEIDNSLTLARINLAIALLYVPDHAAAAKEATAALQQQPDAPQAHYVLGLVARSENHPEEGIAAFKRVLAADPRDVGALVNLGQLLMQNRQYAEAAALFRTAVEAEPYHVTATYNLAVALTRSGSTEEGQKLTQRFQMLRESGYGTTFSNNYLEQGRFAEALVSTGAEPDLVNTATPAVEFVEARVIDAPTVAPSPAAPSPAAVNGTGSMTLADLDRDDDLDLIDVTMGTVRVSLNEKGRFTDATTKLGIAVTAGSGGAGGTGSSPSSASRSGAAAVLVGDYDNDERPDIFVIGSSPSAHVLYHQGEDGRFENRSAAAKLPAPTSLLRAGAFADIDHDGDLDLFLTGGSNQVLRNNGDGTFADITAEAKLSTVADLQAQAVVPTDYDNRRDLDLLVVGAGRGPVLFRNMRDGTFQDAAKEAALPGGVTFISVAAGDVNKDGFVDLFLGRQGAVGTLLLNERGAAFRAVEAGPAPTNAVTSQFIDYDNDGLLDLVTLSTTGRGSVFRNLGRTWVDVTTTAFKTINPPEEPNAASALASSSSSKPVPGGFLGFVAGDLDRDGDTDLIVKARGGAMAVLENQGGNKNASVRVRLTGRASNRSGIGSKVEVRAGSLWQRLELTSTSPAIAPADISFGLGTRAQADVVRVLWPAGIVQAEPLADPKAPSPTTAPNTVPSTAPKVTSLAFTELDRKPSSCPYLYTWNGEKFEFVTDFMGGGEMGYLHEPGVRSVPDPVEYVRIRGDQLEARDGRYELRVTNELEEALFVDRLRLLAIAHPPEVEVHPNEGLFAPPFPDHELMIARDVKPATAVFDHAGRDVTARAAARDRQFIGDGDLPIEKIRGYARPHTLTIEMGGAEGCAAPDLLLLTGWTDYAFSSDNVAAHQAGLAMLPPSLAVRDNNGQWQTVIENIGIPVGRPQTIVVDLSEKWISASREVRISTSMRIYWDQIQVASRDRSSMLPLPGALGAASRIVSTTLDPITADLRWRGFSAEATKGEPFTYDYARVSTTSPWKVMPGRYTREGDVRELLRATDDMFVVSRPGDEIALSFDASALPPLPAGWTRTFLLYSDGYSKEMDLNSASPDQAWPLPFHKMTTYPYAAPERFPLTDAHRAYIERYNTRVVHRPMSNVPIAPTALAAPAAPVAPAAPAAPVQP